MKKFLIQPCVLMIAAAGMLFSSCGGNDGPGEPRPAMPTVNVEFVGNPGVSSVNVKFVPTENTDKYEFAIGNDQDRVNFENGDIPGTVTEMSNTERTQEWTDLEAEAYYVIYARAYNDKGEAGPVSALGFKTSTADFMVKTYYIGDNSAGFMITSTNDYYKFQYALGEAAEYEKDKEDFENGLMKDTQTKNETFAWGANYLDIKPDTEYVFYCKGYDRSGRETQLFEIPFKTYEDQSAEIPNFKLENGEQDFFMQEYIVTPNAMCKQLVLHQQAPGDNDGVMYGENNWQGRLLDMFDAWKDVDGMDFAKCYTATDEVLVAKPYTLDLELEAKLEVHVVAYDEMYKPYLVKKFTNTTPAYNPNAALPDASDLKIEITKVTSDTIYFDVDFTSDNIRAYVYDIVEAKYYDETLKGDPKQLRDHFLANYTTKGWHYKEKHLSQWYTDAKNLIPGEDFFVAALPMNENGTEGWAEDVVMSERVTIPVQ